MYEDKCSVTYEVRISVGQQPGFIYFFLDWVWRVLLHRERGEVRGKHKHYYGQADYQDCYKIFILQTVYDTVTEQKCETKGRVQQKLINQNSQPTTVHFIIFLNFSVKNWGLKTIYGLEIWGGKPHYSSIFVDPFPKYETTYDEQCAPGKVEPELAGNYLIYKYFFLQWRRLSTTTSVRRSTKQSTRYSNEK